MSHPIEWESQFFQQQFITFLHTPHSSYSIRRRSKRSAAFEYFHDSKAFFYRLNEQFGMKLMVTQQCHNCTHVFIDYFNHFSISLARSLFLCPESAKKEYFERNFAWHAITEARTDLTANVENATIMFIRPSPDSKSKDRLGTMKTTYNLKVNDYLRHNNRHRQ